MLSIHSISSSGAGGMVSYFDNLASTNNYYSSSADVKEPAGYWLGGGAKCMKLSGNLKHGELLYALTGYHPATGKPLAKNAGDVHKPGWDCTYSAPKSVSAIWAIAGTEMRNSIEAAHRYAVAESVKYLEANAASTRHGKGGFELRRVSDDGGLIVAVYQHSTSRNQDPQLHSHCVVANLTPDGRGIDLDTAHKMTAGALYRVELAFRLRQMGFHIEKEGQSFSISGVPKNLMETWSSRRAEIEKSLMKSGKSGAVASKVAALNTRQKKEEIGQDVLRARWIDQANAHKFFPESVHRICGYENLKTDLEPLKSGQEIATDLTSQHSTFTRLQALHLVAVDAQGSLSVAQTLSRAEGIFSAVDCADIVSLGIVSRRDAEFSNMKSGDRFTTVEMQAIEKKMLETVQRLADKSGFSVDTALAQKCAEGRNLSKQQMAALDHITASNSASVVEGWAGTGKSYLLAAARETWHGAGYKVLGAALSNVAAENLETEAGIESTSVAKLMFDLSNGNIILDTRTVLVLDEAGLVGSRQTAALIQKVEDSGSKIVLVGDRHQLQAIGAGAAFRAVGDHIGRAELDQVRRQHSQQDRDIAKDFREGRAGDALQKLDDLKRLHVECDMHQARSAAAKGYLSDRDEGLTSLLLATTREEVWQLNAMVRNELKSSGKIEADGVICMTASGYREFAPRDKVVFGERHYFGERDDKENVVINGSTGVIICMLRDEGKPQMLVRLDKSGKTVTVNLDHPPKLDHAYASTIHKSQGVTVDRVHFVAGDFSGREQSYVAASRNRDSVQIYTSKDWYVRPDKGQELEKSDLARVMSKSLAKDISTDYPGGILLSQMPPLLEKDAVVFER